jgi:hypothetical protein
MTLCNIVSLNRQLRTGHVGKFGGICVLSVKLEETEYPLQWAGLMP